MSRIASAADFESEMGWYYNPAGRRGDSSTRAAQGYRRYPAFVTRATDIKQRFLSGTILIAGCGWGYTIEELLSIDPTLDVWGCDAAQYCLDKAQTELNPTAAARILLGDCTDSVSMDTVRRAAGLRGNRQFTAIVTEDLLTMADDDTEALQMVSVLRDISQANLLHIVSVVSQGETRSGPPWLFHTAAEWVALLSPPDVVVNARTLEVLS